MFLSDPYGEKLSSTGIVNNELFRIGGQFNHATAKNVCKAFDARQPSRAEIGRIAKEAEYGQCSAYVYFK